MVIDLYAMIALLSRTTRILNDEKLTQENKDYILDLCRIAFEEHRYHFISQSKGMSKNADKVIERASARVSKFEGYGIDIIDL
jgi:hypothetical protein